MPPENASLDRRGILVKFHEKDTKVQVVINNIKKRTPGLFINEQLTREVNEIYTIARKLKKDNPSKIATLHTRDGVIRAKKSRNGDQYNIFTGADLDDFKHDIGL